MIAAFLQTFWSGIFGHHLLFAYGFGLSFVFDLSNDSRSIIRFWFSLVILVTLSVIVSGFLFMVLFRPGSFSWIGLPTFNFGFLNYFAYLSIVFFLSDRIPGFLKQHLKNGAFLQKELVYLEKNLSLYSVRFLAFGVCLLVDYFAFSYPQAVAFGMGSSIGFGIGLLAIWCVMTSLRRVKTMNNVSDFALKIGILGGVGLLFSLF